MRFSTKELDKQSLYKILTSTVTPRPIAWVTSYHQDSAENTAMKVNAAPFSFFNIMGSEPPLAVFSVAQSLQNGKKDTISNILNNGEFVVNLVSEALAPAMNITAMDAPYGFDELQAAGVETAPSQQIKTPRIKKAPVAFECVNHATMLTGKHQYLVIGRIVDIYIEDQYISDDGKFYIDTPALNLIGRMHGGAHYTRCQDLLQLQRVSYQDFQKAKDKKL